MDVAGWGFGGRGACIVFAVGLSRGLGFFEEFGGVGACGLGLVGAAEESGKFLDAVLLLEGVESGEGASVAVYFSHAVVAVGAGCDLGEVADGENLSVCGEGLHFLADAASGLAGDAGVNLVEDEGGDGVGAVEECLEAEHDAGEFAAGGDFAQGAKGFAGVGAEEEFDLFEAVGAGAAAASVGQFEAESVGVIFVGLEGLVFEPCFEAQARHFEFLELSDESVGELLGGLGAGLAEGECGLGGLGGEGLEFGLDFAASGVAVGEAVAFGLEAFGLGEDVFEGLAVLALEALEAFEAFEDGLEPGGVVLDVLGVVAQFGGEVGGFGEEALEAAGLGLEPGVEACGGVEFLAGASQQGFGGGFFAGVFVEQGVGGVGGMAEGFGVFEASAFGLEFVVLAGAGVGLADFVELVVEQVALAFEVLALAVEAAEFVAEGFMAVVEVAVLLEGGGQGGASEAVEDFAVAFDVEEGLVLVLSVEVDEEVADLAELGEGEEIAVCQGAAASGGGDFAAQDEFVVRSVNAGLVEERGEGGVAGDVEEGLDFGRVAAPAHVVAAGAFAEDELERTDDDGLAGSGLAGQAVESGIEVQGEVVDDGQIADAQAQQHGAGSSFGGGPSAVGARGSAIVSTGAGGVKRARTGIFSLARGISLAQGFGVCLIIVCPPRREPGDEGDGLMFVDWNRDWETGYGEIDEDHRGLFAALNSLHEAYSRSLSHEETLSRLDALIEMGECHFKREEAHMKRHRFPGLSVHRREHRELLEQARFLEKSFREEDVELSAKLMDFLKQWVCEHQEGADREYYNFLRRLENDELSARRS